MLQSDKLYHHFYQRYYDDLFSAYSKKTNVQKINVLEIGVEKGFSINFWNNYFDKVFIAGIDKNPQIEASVMPDNFVLFKGDQTDDEFLDNIIITRFN